MVQAYEFAPRAGFWRGVLEHCPAKLAAMRLPAAIAAPLGLIPAT